MTPRTRDQIDLLERRVKRIGRIRCLRCDGCGAEYRKPDVRCFWCEGTGVEPPMDGGTDENVAE